MFCSGLFLHLGESSTFGASVSPSVNQAFPSEDPRVCLPASIHFRFWSLSQDFQAFNSSHHTGIWKHKSTFSIKTAPNGERIKVSLEIRRKPKVTSHKHAIPESSMFKLTTFMHIVFYDLLVSNPAFMISLNIRPPFHQLKCVFTATQEMKQHW